MLKKAGLGKLSNMFVTSIGNATNVEDALIKVENIKAPTLLVSSSNDYVWPSNEMASFICEKMNVNEVKWCTHANFENGSHTMQMGQEFKTDEVLTGDIADVTREIANFLNATNN